MDQDSLQRDRLLTRLDERTEYLVNSQKNVTQALVDHAHVDDTRFGKIDNTLEDLKKFKWRSTAIVGGLIIAIDIFIKIFK